MNTLTTILGPSANLNTTIRQISTLDKLAKQKLPHKISSEVANSIPSPNGNTLRGRYVYSEKPDTLLDSYEPTQERFITVQELIIMRLKAFQILLDRVPNFKEAINESLEKGEYSESFYNSLPKVLKELNDDTETFGILSHRITTSTNMVRADDETANDKLFICHGNPFSTKASFTTALKSEVSDGAVKYDTQTIENIKKMTSPKYRIPFSEYLNHYGGNYNGEGMRTHLMFKTVAGDECLAAQYIFAYQVLSHIAPYQKSTHSTWLPRGIPKNTGRIYALGAGADFLYPVNRTTKSDISLLISEPEHKV